MTFCCEFTSCLPTLHLNNSTQSFRKAKIMIISPTANSFGEQLSLLCSRFYRHLLIPLFVLFLLTQASAKTVTIGSGSGSLSVTSMGSLSLVSGDVLSITTGTYSGGTFTNLSGITIVPATGGVIFTGTIYLGSLAG